MKAYRLPRRTWSGLLALLAMGCSGVDPRPVRLEVFSWWQELSERSAFNRLVEAHQAAHPEVEVRNSTYPAASTARWALTARMLAGAPPATFQANVGADMLRWTTVDSVPIDGSPHSESRIVPLSDLYDDLGLTRVLPEAVLSAVRIGRGENHYAVPINIHRINTVYYDPERAAAFELKHGRSFLDIELLCPENWATAAALELKIGISTQDTFPLILLAFENLLPALTDGEFYARLFRGEAPESRLGGADWTFDVRRALQCFKYLSQSFIDGHANLSWAQATATVADGPAAFTVMGDWAEGLLTDALAQGQVESSVFPGTEGLFIFTSDTFSLPFGTPHPVEAEAFLRTVASAPAQVAFSREKGSIPARTDLDSELDQRSLRKRRDFEAAEPLLATSGLFPGYFPVDSLGQLLRELVHPNAGEREIEHVITLLRDAHPLLALWQDRLARGPATPPP